jgi:hypothetical protein
MDALKETLAPAWVGSVLSLAGLIVGLVALLAALVLYRASRIRGGLSFQQDSVTLISNEPASLPGEIEVRFHDLPVPRLTRTVTILWNDGNTTIRALTLSRTIPFDSCFPTTALRFSAWASRK